MLVTCQFYLKTCWLNLRTAQRWFELEIVDLEDCNCVVIKGRPTEEVSRLGLQSEPFSCWLVTIRSLAGTFCVRLSNQSLDADFNKRVILILSSYLAQSSWRIVARRLNDIFSSLTRYTNSMEAPTPSTIFLAITERDSSCVYYVLNNGIVSPKEVEAWWTETVVFLTGKDSYWRDGSS